MIGSQRPGPGTAELLATWFGAGHFPVAPGTAGTLGALPLYWLLRRAPWPLYGVVCSALALVGIWASNEMARRAGEADPQEVVIDEVAGVLWALAWVRGRGLPVELGAVVLFRLLDILKPGPIRTAERAKPAGLGIMLDDLLAGLGAGLLARWGGRLLR